MIEAMLSSADLHSLAARIRATLWSTTYIDWDGHERAVRVSHHGGDVRFAIPAPAGAVPIMATIQLHYGGGAMVPRQHTCQRFATAMHASVVRALGCVPQ